MVNKEKVENKHTPTPWKSIREDYRGNADKLVIHSSDDHRIAVVDVTKWEDDERGFTEIEEANAAFIVRAVNCHEDLLIAMKKIKEWYAPTANGGWADHQDAITYQLACQAIARAEEK